ncbi:hypothetical protein D5086_009166 [Populus alba]|uniref:Uncharacterized protein n=1 Tax=Populus alba TaxID=43335 RepID=A0ACC4CHT5_POPAL
MIELAMAALGSFKIIKHRSPLHLMDTRGYFQRNVRICMSTNPFFDIGTSNLKARGICKKQCLRVSEGKASPKRDFRALLRGRNHRSLKSNLTESIGQVNGGCVVSHTNENGFVRMKLVVRKQDLKQMLEVMRGGKSNANQASYSPVIFVPRTTFKSSEEKASFKIQFSKGELPAFLDSCTPKYS